MGEALEVAKVLVAPTMKLLDMVGGAIGTAYEPRHKRKMADATVYEINTIGEAMRNAADLPIVYNQDGVAINSEDFNRLMQRAGTRLVLQETVKQHNIESVVDNAYEILEKEEHCSDEPVEQGWVNRFFDSVADVSDEDLQKLWGKILAGEIKQPRSYSLRTLETLKNITPYEASIFQKIAKYVLIDNRNYNIAGNVDDLSNYEIKYRDIMLLGECGLINFTGVSYFLNIGREKKTVFINNLPFLFDNSTSKEIVFELSVFSLTTAGKELYNIIEHNDDNVHCALKWINKMLESKNFEQGKVNIYNDKTSIIINITE